MMKLLCFWPQSLVHLAVFWWLGVCVYRNEKAAQLPSTSSLTRESRDPQTPSQEPPGSVGTDPGRIMGKEVKEEQNRLKGFTVCWLAAICAYYVTVCLCSLFYFFFLCFLAVPNSTKNTKYPSYDPIGVLTSDVPFLPSCSNDFLASIRSHIQHSLLVQFAPSFVSDKALLSVILNFQSFIDPGTTHPDVSMGRGVPRFCGEGKNWQPGQTIFSKLPNLNVFISAGIMAEITSFGLTVGAGNTYWINETLT